MNPATRRVYALSLAFALAGGSVFGAPPAGSPSGAKRPSLPCTIDARALAGKPMSRAASLLKAAGWNTVKIAKRDEALFMNCRTAASKPGDTWEGLIQYHRGELLFAGFGVTGRLPVTSALVEEAFQITALPPPASKWASGMRWESLSPAPRKVEASVSNITTDFKATYASEAAIQRWKNAP